MLTSPLSLSPASADLKDLLIACSQHPLHTEFRGCMEEPFTRGYGIDVGFWGWGRNTIGSLNLKITFLNKKLSYGLDEACPLLKDFPALGKDPVFHY
jgi:hypothetical protein